METEIETKPIVVRKVPIHLWQQLKVRAAVENETIQTTIAKAIEQYLKSA